MEPNELDLEDKRQELPEQEYPRLVGDVYPVFLDFNNENLQDLTEGLLKCERKNPDPTYSIHKLVARFNELIVFSEDLADLALVTEVRVDDFGFKYLFLWGAYANKSKYDTKKAINTLRWACAKLECSYVETCSQRAGWFRLLDKYGIQAIPTITYRMEL